MTIGKVKFNTNFIVATKHKKYVCIQHKTLFIRFWKSRDLQQRKSNLKIELDAKITSAGSKFGSIIDLITY